MISFKLKEQISFHFAIKFFFISIILILFACNSSNHSKDKEANYSSPNFILVLADDQGWNGTSVKMMYNESGSKSDYFETPNLELLSQRGMRFSDVSNSSLSIDEVISGLHNNVDKATVYRALNAFEKNGLIHKVPDKDNLLRYALCQKECSPTKHSHNHAHLLCDKCNSTYCLNDFKIPIENNYNGFIVSNSKIILEGRCVDCQ